MALKHTITTSIRSDVGAGISDVIVLTGPAEENASVVVPAGGSVEIDLNIDVSQIISGYLKGDQAVTVKTNDDTTPAQTFSLTGGRSLGWYTGNGYTNPFTTDITKLFIHNAGSVDSNFVASFLLDVAV